ncbi:MAG TPA: GNAT family N-acetyltransferase [Jatrophihabitantaceae bacterium]|jgi:ribosomal protein S18 acetylase RimI-like enzyme
MTYTWRSLVSADTPQWAELTRAVSDADDLDEAYTSEDLAAELDDPGIDPALDTVAVDAEDGTLIAVGQVNAPMVRTDGTVRAGFYGSVHPAHRGRGIGAELLRRLERRAAELAAERHPGADAQLSTHVGSTTHDAHALFEANGFRPVRYYHALTRPLAGAGPVADDPRVHAYDPARDAEVHAAHCEAFSTHWGFAPPDAQQWRTWLTGSRPFRARYSMLGLGPEGRIDGYLLAYNYQPGELYIGQLGVRPAARGQGLARALLVRSLAAAAPDLEIAKLDVDSENADGAGRLYESVGFTRQRGTVVYVRD